MKAIVAFILMVALSVVASMFLPWWWLIAPICFLAGMTFTDNGWQAFFIGFLAIFLVWGITAALNSYQNDFILLNRINDLLGSPSSVLVILATALIGGLVGALSSLSGYYLQTINDKPRRRY